MEGNEKFVLDNLSLHIDTKQPDLIINGCEGLEMFNQMVKDCWRQGNDLIIQGRTILKYLKEN